MGQYVAVFSKEVIAEMKKHYEDYLEAPPPGAVFCARTRHTVITAYGKSGKVLFQGEHPEMEAEKWSGDSGIVEKKPKVNKKPPEHSFAPPGSLFNNNHIGSDESGTGDYFGPITTCAVYVQAEQIEILRELGIQDSKVIKDKCIVELSQLLVEMNIPYSLMILHNEKYNRLQQSGWSQGKMKAMLHDSTIKSLLGKIRAEPLDGILIDQFCSPEIYLGHIASEGSRLDTRTYFMTKAENNSIAVAAGSVIARAAFLREMERLSKIAGVTLKKGASAKVDAVAARVIREKGESFLNQIAKVHFANTGKARGMV